jgi:hypothetical protein
MRANACYSEGDMDQAIRHSLVNLIDAFFNARLQKELMDRAPLTDDLTHFLCSDRMRLERAWLTFLHVLVESWQSPQMKPVADWLATAVPNEYQSLLHALHAAGKDGTLEKIHAVRDYMCHRDRRVFWDAGRKAVFGTHETAIRFHDAFDQLLRGAVQSTKEPPETFCGEEYWYQVLTGGTPKADGAA